MESENKKKIAAFKKIALNVQTVGEYKRVIENDVREPTAKNQLSSRSHVIVILEATIKDKCFRLFISDLAGSENSKKSNTTGGKIVNLKVFVLVYFI